MFLELLLCITIGLLAIIIHQNNKDKGGPGLPIVGEWIDSILITEEIGSTPRAFDSWLGPTKDLHDVAVENSLQRIEEEKELNATTPPTEKTDEVSRKTFKDCGTASDVRSARSGFDITTALSIRSPKYEEQFENETNAAGYRIHHHRHHHRRHRSHHSTPKTPT